MSNKLKYAPNPPPEPILPLIPTLGPKKRGRKATKKQYFTPDTDLAIAEYLKGSKAFSYFSIVGKNYLILYNNSNYQKKKQKVDVLKADEDDGVLHQLGRDGRKEEMKTFIDYMTEYIDKHMFTMFKKDKDRKVCDAINILFKRRENLEIFNKKALYIYIREMTGVDTPIITKVTKKLKVLYKDLYDEYDRTGYVRV